MGGMEEYGVVIDFLPYGKATDMRKEPLAQIIGETYYTLLEVVPKPGVILSVGERIYIGKGPRDKIERIKSKISYFELTSAARDELEKCLRKIIKSKEKEAVNFFNKCGPITLRLHQLELLPGVGKKHMLEIINEREKKPFESFEDIHRRIPFLPDPVKILTDRIIHELKGERYYILTKPPFKNQHKY